MGGFGSGRQGGKLTTSNTWRLDVRRLHRSGLLVPGKAFNWEWSENGERAAYIGIYVNERHITLKYRIRKCGDEWENKEYPVTLEWTACHFGGQRPWFLCPCCGRRAAVLFGREIYACRRCHNLAYPCQREDKHGRLLSRAQKIQRRLSWDGPNGWHKPKGMHWRTFERLVLEHERFDKASWLALAEKFNLFHGGPDD